MSEQKVLLNQMPIAIKDSTIDITSEKLTKELAKKFTKYLKGGEFVFLYGEMGVGKTTFVKYFINEYQKINNLTQTEITSPTFSLLNEYQVKDIRIKHYDLFRINRKEDINNLDIFEKDNKLITLIEWPQMIIDNLQIDNYFIINLEIINHHERIIKITHTHKKHFDNEF